MQVYFIDNDEYFGRKYALKDKANKFYADNDERAIFYCRGVLETVKKLGWAPDIIHCHGWMTALIPLYIKKVFNDDPIFENSKVIYSVYNEGFDKTLDKRFIQKAVIDGVNIKNLKTAEKPDFDSINKLAIEWSDGVVKGSEELSKDMDKYINSLKKKKPVLEYFNQEEYVEKYDEFYDSILEEELVKK
jgi:starch synthase